MIFYIESHRVKTGLQLIKTSTFIGLANVELLNEDATIKEYKEWKRGYIQNAISVNDKTMYPQTISISSIEDMSTVRVIAKDCLDSLNSSNDICLDEEDVLVPFFGGVKNDNFNTLLNRLWKEDTEHFARYRIIVRNYYNQLFRVIDYKQVKKVFSNEN